MRGLIAVAIVAACTACGNPGVGSAESDASACPVCAECPAQPDPVPCVRSGQAMAGGSDALLSALDDGDATDIGAAVGALRARIDAFESCSASLLDEIL